MAKVGAQRAAVLTGKSKSTIQRAMNSGKLSYELDQNKRRIIDVSELERVFGIKQTQQEAQPSAATTQQDVSSDILIEKERLAMTVKMLEQQLDDAKGNIDDLKDQRDKWEKQASQVLITSQYTQKQAEELRAQIKEREERARQRRLQNAQLQKAQSRSAKSSGNNNGIDSRLKNLYAENQNASKDAGSVFRFWKRAKG